MRHTKKKPCFCKKCAAVDSVKAPDYKVSMANVLHESKRSAQAQAGKEDMRHKLKVLEEMGMDKEDIDKLVGMMPHNILQSSILTKHTCTKCGTEFITNAPPEMLNLKQGLCSVCSKTDMFQKKDQSLLPILAVINIIFMAAILAVVIVALRK